MCKRKHLRRIMITKHKETQKIPKEIEGRSSILKENPTSEMDQLAFFE
ncbi:Phosphoenolpyruvate carboxylase [Gossypium arboreum]|uniref:Phosphoenolpyruvate carboxylase n=1 Tax=Gossypium arboreum TaxID=29729 RepID=A0A0B0MEB1_GOSAR|nr:Phosphoenolpyruvate carboxylase [Gossypium arboreum]